MKKNLLALAVLGTLAGAASAQSSVTLYGDIDLGVVKGNGGTALNNGGNGTSRAWQLRQSHSSRIGFRGNEDLGGGLSAQFQIEHRFNPDTGAQNGNVFWFGRSYVQLTSVALGSVYLGRDYMPAFYPAVKSDPFGFDGVGQFGTLMYANYSVNDRVLIAAGQPGAGTPAAATAGTVTETSRTNNTLGYKSPNLYGLTVQLAGAASEGTAAVGREYGGNIEYNAGPIYAAVAYDRTQRGQAQFDGNSLLSAAFHFNFGYAKVMAYAARSKTGLTDASNKFYSIGVLAPIGPGTVKAGFAYYDPTGNSNSAKKFGLGYDYSLSKRTNLYADIGHGRQGRIVTPTTPAFSTNTSYAFGVKHLF